MQVTNLKKEEYFRTGILQWFEKSGREFPWRKKDLSLYESLIAEILLQQTRAENVQKVYPKLLEKFSGWEELAQADISEIEEVIRPLGLFRKRARGLKKLASDLLESSREGLDSLDALMNLPCIGPYIGRSVLVNCYDRPEPMLDVNMARVIERYFGPRKMADIRDDKELNALAKRLVSKAKPKEYNWGVMDFASEVCKAGEPNCEACPISKHCKTYQEKEDK